MGARAGDSLQCGLSARPRGYAPGVDTRLLPLLHEARTRLALAEEDLEAWEAAHAAGADVHDWILEGLRREVSVCRRRVSELEKRAG
jgi:hypothetical protein